MKIVNPTGLVAVVVAVLLCRATAGAQAIVGNVSTTFGAPISGVLVTATRASPFQQVTDTTDAAGNYSLGSGIRGLSGTYSVVPTKSGYTFTPASTNVSVLFSDVTVNFITPATVPSVTALAAQNVTPTSATLSATINPEGADTLARLEYGLTTSYGSSFIKNAGGGSSPENVSIGVTGLLNGTNYHFRFSASNSLGVSFGADQGFATLSGIPSVTTLDPTGGGATSMALNGSVNPNGASAVAWFEWGDTTNYGNATPNQNSGGGTFATNFSQALTGLVSGTTYHCRAVAMTSFATNSGADVLFTPIFANFNAGLPAVSGGSVAWGDYDNDGLLDILLTGLPENAGVLSQVWRNTGGGFVNINAGLPGVIDSSGAWGDDDDDGGLDILLTGYTGASTLGQVWRNTGSGFVNINAGLPAVFYGSAAWGDYDNDGRQDILLTGWDVNLIPIAQVWRNTGNGFSNINAGLPGVVHGSAAWGDFDNDGRLDILITGFTRSSGPLSQIWRNTGGGFTNINAGLPGLGNSSVALGDFDNDGRLDILLAGSDADLNLVAQVWRNTGSGFVNINAGLPGVISGSVACADYDNDGRLDILLMGLDASGKEIAQLWRNTVTGFVNMNAGLPGVARAAAVWGDYDNDGRLDILLSGTTSGSPSGAITQVWRNNTPLANTAPASPAGLAASASGATATLSWNPASDSQTPSAGLSYNVRVGTAPGGSDIVSPMSAANGFRRLPRIGNTQLGLTSTLSSIQLGQTYYWSVQAVDSAFAGSAFAPEQSFTVNTVLTPPNGVPVPGDLNGDGVVSQSEFAAVLANLNGNGIVSQSDLDLVLSNYWPYSPWLYMTNVAGLGGTNVTFALTNSTVGAFSVEYTTNFIDWLLLGPATPRYLFTDTNAPAVPQRYYRLRWP